MATTVPSGQGYLHLALDCIPSLLDVNFLSWPSVAGMILHKTLMRSRVYSVNSPFHPRLNKQEKQDELASLGIRCVLSLSGGGMVCGCSFLVAQLTWSHLHSHEVHCFTKLNLDPFFWHVGTSLSGICKHVIISYQKSYNMSAAILNNQTRSYYFLPMSFSALRGLHRSGTQVLAYLGIFYKILDRNNPITMMFSWEFATCHGLNSSPQCPIVISRAIH